MSNIFRLLKMFYMWERIKQFTYYDGPSVVCIENIFNKNRLFENVMFGIATQLKTLILM